MSLLIKSLNLKKQMILGAKFLEGAVEPLSLEAEKQRFLKWNGVGFSPSFCVP